VSLDCCGICGMVEAFDVEDEVDFCVVLNVVVDVIKVVDLNVDDEIVGFGVVFIGFVEIVTTEVVEIEVDGCEILDNSMVDDAVVMWNFGEFVVLIILFINTVVDVALTVASCVVSPNDESSFMQTSTSDNNNNIFMTI